MKLLFIVNFVVVCLIAYNLYSFIGNSYKNIKSYIKDYTVPFLLLVIFVIVGIILNYLHM